MENYLYVYKIEIFVYEYNYTIIYNYIIEITNKCILYSFIIVLVSLKHVWS